MPYKKPILSPDWIKSTEVAAQLGVDPRTVRAMVRDGRLKVRMVRFDQATRIHRADWETELAKRIQMPVSA
jgi:excisionase family DNA binding protein